MATIFTSVIDTNDNGWSNFSIRVIVKITGNAEDQVRVTLQGHSTSGFSLDNVAIGISGTSTQGDPADTLASTTATPVPLLFSGASAVSASGATQKVSDWANLTGFTSTNFLVVVMDFANAHGFDAYDGLASTFAAGGPAFTAFKTATDSYNVQTASGFSGLANQCHLVALIETQAAAAEEEGPTLTQVIHAHVGMRIKPIGY